MFTCSFLIRNRQKSLPSTPDILFDLVWLFVFHGWMDGWMDGWMNGWMGGCVFKAGSGRLWSPQCSAVEWRCSTWRIPAGCSCTQFLLEVEERDGMVTREPPWPIAPPRHLPPDGISIRKSRGVMTNRWTGARAGGLEGWGAGGLEGWGTGSWGLEDKQDTRCPRATRTLHHDITNR